MGSWLEVGTLDGWIMGDAVPGTTFTVTANDLDLALPGFSTKYGADAIVDIYGACTNLRSF